MKKIFLATLVVMFLQVSFWVMAGEAGNKPVTVSPGSETEAVTVWQSCPTFSWSAVDQASSYRVEVFESTEANILTYEEMASMTSPIISKDIPGPALSWTLSAEEKLKTGGQYAWYVLAVDAYGNALGSWSGGRIFRVEQEVRFAGLKEKLEEILKSYGVNEETISKVLNEMKEEVQEVVVSGAEGTKGTGGTGVINTPGRSGVQGYEGITNTFYGQNAGASTETNNNTFVGASAGYANIYGYDNTFLGYYAGRYNTFGDSNTFLGYYAGCSNTVGYANVFLGYYTGGSNTYGMYNTFIGNNAGASNGWGYCNTFLGLIAGGSNTSGNDNTYLGVGAGYGNTTGSGNLFLGNLAGYNETGSNKLYIDNSDTSSPLIYGEFDNNIVTINGKLGIGTTTPDYPMELETTGENAAFVTKRTDGATNFMSATASYAQFGAVSSHPVRILVNSNWKMMVNTDGSLSMVNGASCTAGGVWTNASSRALKENIENLTSAEAEDALSKLNPVKYNYKVDKTDQHVGFIAEDVPDLVATAGRKGMSPMDVIAVLTKVVQEQQNLIREQQKVNREYKKIISDLQERMAKLEKK